MFLTLYFILTAAQGVMVGVLTSMAGFSIAKRPLATILWISTNSALMAGITWAATKLPK